MARRSRSSFRFRLQRRGAPVRNARRRLYRAGRVLVVDQDQSVLDAVGAILHDRNHIVGTASTLSDAKSALSRQDFDVVVADIRTSESPDQTGLPAWLKEHQPALLQRLVWISASAPSEQARYEAFSGAPVLRKPFKAGDLLAAVQAVLSDVHATPVER